MQFGSLLAAGVVWYALHAAIAGSGARFALIERFGEKRYRGAFSLASLVALLWLIHEYGAAPYHPLWVVPSALFYLPVLLVPLAFVLLVGAFSVPNPTGVGGEKALEHSEPARGMLRVTRHPFLWSAVLWALAHLFVNSDAASLIFFASLGLTALQGTFDIDRKRRRTHAETFRAFEAVTSNLPFAAIASGRNRLVLRELAAPIALGLLLAGLTIALHPRLFGAPALP